MAYVTIGQQTRHSGWDRTLLVFPGHGSSSHSVPHRQPPAHLLNLRMLVTTHFFPSACEFCVQAMNPPSEKYTCSRMHAFGMAVDTGLKAQWVVASLQISVPITCDLVLAT